MGTCHGYWAWQGLHVSAAYGVTRYRPRLFWSRDLLHEMLGYGLGYISSIWVWQLRSLVNPLIVGRFLGPEAVGYVSLAIRFADVLSFVKSATWRLSIAALGKVQEDRGRLRKAMEEGMALQVLALGPALAGFALISPWLLPYVFGDRWDPVLDVFPFIALSYLLNAVFNMHSSVLYVLQRNRAVTLFHACHIALFATGALLLVSQVGLIGYGLAEVVALPAYAVSIGKCDNLFEVSYWRVAPWLVGLVPPLFTVFLPMPWTLLLWTPFLGVLLHSQQRNQVIQYLRIFRLRAV